MHLFVCHGLTAESNLAVLLQSQKQKIDKKSRTIKTDHHNKSKLEIWGKTQRKSTQCFKSNWGKI